MVNYYLDIETTGFDFEKDKIITIQYQKLGNEGRVLGDLVILKEWETNEETIVKEFWKFLLGSGMWGVVPIMQNHIFDLTFLFRKFNQYGLECPLLSDYLYDKPIIDIKYTLIIANKLSFRGAGLDNFTEKITDGKQIPIYYNNKEYSKIEEYIKMEAKAFIQFFQELLIKLPSIIKCKQTTTTRNI